MSGHQALSETKICFIGAGAMATAIIAGIRKQDLIPAANITASDPYAPQRERLAADYQIITMDDNLAAVAEQDIVVLSIKPQMLASVGAELSQRIPSDAVVISILAGPTLAKLSRLLAHERMVRVMPNTPALVGLGMSAWTCTAAVPEEQRQQAQAILSALGEAHYFEGEAYLDMATALSGGGPAYVFLFMEALVDAAVHIGFPRPVAEKFVQQTLEGSIALARHEDGHLAALRNRVTSPGGTTVEAIHQLEKNGFRAAMTEAIEAAYKKSQYLGSLDNDD